MRTQLVSIPARLAAQAAVLAAAIMMLATFVLHAPCRNSNYGLDQFTSLCYSDVASMMANAPFDAGQWPFSSGVAVDASPIVAVLLWFASIVPVGLVLNVVLFQLLIAAAFFALTMTVFMDHEHRRLDAALLALTPLWPFVVFINGDLFAVTASAIALYFFRRQHVLGAGIAAGVALASGGWTWVVLLAFIVVSYRDMIVRLGLVISGIAVAVAGVLNLPRILSGLPLFAPMSFQVGEGSVSYVMSRVSYAPFADVRFIAILGVAFIGLIAWFAARIEFDWRPELLILIFVVVQLLSSPAISPQNLVRLAWLIPVVFALKKFVIGYSLPLIAYVIAVWMLLEAGTEGGKGLSPQMYAVFCFIMWTTLIVMSAHAWKMLKTPGHDPVLIGDTRGA